MCIHGTSKSSGRKSTASAASALENAEELSLDDFYIFSDSSSEQDLPSGEHHLFHNVFSNSQKCITF